MIKVSNTCSTIELSPHYSGTEGFEPSTTAFTVLCEVTCYLAVRINLLEFLMYD
uniref:Uncharacterized protein n=1 Tax=Siphoviridae sp. ctYh54 TaxID=2826379 RepID=A0A8S5MDR1_9CAUD|nr:MAG TPA: hypothetical protein [Siphoviridae sp. ctYh54]